MFRDGDDYRAIVPAELRVEVGRGDGDVSGQLILGGQRLALRRCKPPSLHARCARRLRRVVREPGGREPTHDLRRAVQTLIVEYGLGCDKGLAFAMEPIAPDVFLVRLTAPGIAYRHVFRFDRDAAGRVTSAVVTMERLKGLRLWRVSPAREPTVG